MPQGHLNPRSGRRDSNPRPSPWQGDALPTEPRPRAPGCVQNCSRSCRSRKLGRAKSARRHASIQVETRLRYGQNMTVPAQPVPYDTAGSDTGTTPYETDIAQAAALIADPTRAAILRALLPDRPLAAGELARLAGVSAATASFHLAKLHQGRMIAVARPAPLLPAGRPRDRRRARGPRPDQPGPAGPQPAAVPRGRRAGRRAHLLRPPGRPGRGGAAGRPAPPWPAGQGKATIFVPNEPG